MAAMSGSPYTIRRFVPGEDDDAVARILIEVGWGRPSDREERTRARRNFQNAADSFVAEVDGAAECYVSTMRGSYWYRDEAVPFSGVTGVVTSRVARKQGLASRTTARALADCALAGSVVAGLGIFDQGFYDKLGFGAGGYEHVATIDPVSLTVPYCRRTPVRLGAEDAPEMHAARLVRRRLHGTVALDAPETTAFTVQNSPTDFGLGFRDEAGTLTHHMWIHADTTGAGPYRVWWTAFTTVEQYVELLGLLRNFGDQVYLLWMTEPPGIQLQDFIERPFRTERLRRRGEYETTNRALANYQYRILDVERAFAIAARKVDLPSFTMRVGDPVTRYLSGDESWRGVGGDYRVDSSGAHRLAEPATTIDLEIGVGDLTRAWLSVLPMSTLAAIGGVHVSPDLAKALDRAFAGPTPRTDWMY